MHFFGQSYSSVLSGTESTPSAGSDYADQCRQALKRAHKNRISGLKKGAENAHIFNLDFVLRI